MPRARNVTSIKEDYKNLYNDRTIQHNAEWYKKDIEHWGFDFDIPQGETHGLTKLQSKTFGCSFTYGLDPDCIPRRYDDLI